MTEEELRLWQALRHDLPWKFRRQVPVDRFVVDFLCYPKRLVVEVDGAQHAGSPSDATRDVRLAGLGFRVLRFWNSEVRNELEVVLDTIEEALRAQPNLHRNRRPRGAA